MVTITEYEQWLDKCREEDRTWIPQPYFSFLTKIKPAENRRQYRSWIRQLYLDFMRKIKLIENGRLYEFKVWDNESKLVTFNFTKQFLSDVGLNPAKLRINSQIKLVYLGAINPLDTIRVSSIEPLKVDKK